ncbi:MAG: hypothetical protein JW837_11260 [Sedimentisphaerales bacterium]|nr:hypothetical protein [Sedimentisphaerales bacterium]
MEEKRKKRGLLAVILAGLCLVLFSYFGRGYYHGAKTIHQLLTDNKQLKQSITNLTQEEQIGYAKVISQQVIDNKLMTKIKFVETARDDKRKKILEKEYTIEGDIIHFDALIVKFSNKMVMDGKSRALYLWRRIYGEKMAPEKGFHIEQRGTEPQRYKDLLEVLPVKDSQMFWSNIWLLANDTRKLKAYDIEAVYGNVIYEKLTTGLIYIFKISPSGQVYPETVPDM